MFPNAPALQLHPDAPTAGLNHHENPLEGLTPQQTQRNPVPGRFEPLVTLSEILGKAGVSGCCHRALRVAQGSLCARELLTCRVHPQAGITPSLQVELLSLIPASFPMVLGRFPGFWGSLCPCPCSEDPSMGRRSDSDIPLQWLHHNIPGKGHRQSPAAGDS